MSKCNCNNINLKHPVYNPCKHRMAEAEDYFPLEKVNELKTFLENLEKCLVADLKLDIDISILGDIVEKLDYILQLLAEDDASTVTEAAAWLQGYSEGLYSYDLHTILTLIDKLKLVPEKSKYYDSAQSLIEILQNLAEKVTFSNEDISIIIEILNEYKKYVSPEKAAQIEEMITMLNGILDGTYSWSDIDVSLLYQLLKEAMGSEYIIDNSTFRKWFEEVFWEKYQFWKSEYQNTIISVNQFEITETKYYYCGETFLDEATIKSKPETAWLDTYNQSRGENPIYIWKRDKYELQQQSNDETEVENFVTYQYTWFVLLPEGVVEGDPVYRYAKSSDEQTIGDTITPIQPSVDSSLWERVYPTSFADGDKYLWTEETKTYIYPEDYNGDPVVEVPHYSWTLIGYTPTTLPPDVHDGNDYYEDEITYCSKKADGTPLEPFENFNSQSEIIEAEKNGIIRFNESTRPAYKEGLLFWKKISRTRYTVHIVDGVTVVETQSGGVFYEATYWNKNTEKLTTNQYYIYVDEADVNNPPSPNDSRWSQPIDNSQIVSHKYYWEKTTYIYTDTVTGDVKELEDIIILHKQGEQGLPGKNGEDGKDGTTTIYHDGGIKEERTVSYTVLNSGKNVMPRDTELNNLASSVWVLDTDSLQWVPGSWMITRYTSDWFEYNTNTQKYERIGYDAKHPAVQYPTKQYFPFDGTTPKSLYMWQKWATNSTPSPSEMSDYPINGNYTYLGIAVNKETNIPSTNYKDYVWKLFDSSQPTNVDGVFYWFSYLTVDPTIATSSDLHNEYQEGDKWWGTYECVTANDSRPTDPSKYKWAPIGQGIGGDPNDPNDPHTTKTDHVSWLAFANGDKTVIHAKQSDFSNITDIKWMGISINTHNVDDTQTFDVESYNWVDFATYNGSIDNGDGTFTHILYTSSTTIPPAYSDCHFAIQSADTHWGQLTDKEASVETDTSKYSWAKIGDSNPVQPSVIPDKETYTSDAKYLLAYDETSHDYSNLSESDQLNHYANTYDLVTFPIYGTDYSKIYPTDPNGVHWIWKVTKFEITSTNSNTYSFQYDRFFPGYRQSLSPQSASPQDWREFEKWITVNENTLDTDGTALGPAQRLIEIVNKIASGTLKVSQIDAQYNDYTDELIRVLELTLDGLIKPLPYLTEQWAANVYGELKSQQSINKTKVQITTQIQSILSSIESLLQLDQNTLQRLVTQNSFDAWMTALTNKINGIQQKQCTCGCSSHLSDIENKLNNLQSLITTLEGKLVGQQPVPQYIDKVPYGIILPYVGSLDFDVFQKNCGDGYFPLGWMLRGNLQKWIDKYGLDDTNIRQSNITNNKNFESSGNYFRIKGLKLKDGSFVDFPKIDDATFLTQDSAGYDPGSFAINFLKDNGAAVTNQKTISIDNLPLHNHGVPTGELNQKTYTYSINLTHGHDFVIPSGVGGKRDIYAIQSLDSVNQIANETTCLQKGFKDEPGVIYHGPQNHVNHTGLHHPFFNDGLTTSYGEQINEGNNGNTTESMQYYGHVVRANKLNTNVSNVSTKYKAGDFIPYVDNANQANVSNIRWIPESTFVFKLQDEKVTESAGGATIMKVPGKTTKGLPLGVLDKDILLQFNTYSIGGNKPLNVTPKAIQTNFIIRLDVPVAQQ